MANKDIFDILSTYQFLRFLAGSVSVDLLVKN